MKQFFRKILSFGDWKTKHNVEKHFGNSWSSNEQGESPLKDIPGALLRVQSRYWGLFCISFFVFGLAICLFESGWFYLPLLPTLYIFLVKRQPSFFESVFLSYLATTLIFLGGTVLWLPSAIREISGASGPFVILISAIIWGCVGLTGIGAGIGFWLGKGRGYLQVILMSVGAIVVHEALSINVKPTVSELLASNPIVSFWLPSLGTLIMGILIHLFALSAAYFYNIKKLRLALVLIVGALAFLFLVPLVLDEQGSEASKKHAEANDANSFGVLAYQTNFVAEAAAKEVKDLATANSKFVDRRFQEASVEIKKISKMGLKVNLLVTPESGLPLAPAYPIDSDMTERWGADRFFNLSNFFDSFDGHYIGVFVEPPVNTLLSQRVGQAPMMPVAYLYDKTGFSIDRISKSFLVPFAEYIPGEEKFPVLGKIFYWSRGANSKPDRQTFNIEGFKIASMICYDSLFREAFNRAIAEQADLLLILSNDNVLGKRGAWFHYVISKARALEYGVPTVYVGNTGYTGLVSRSDKEAKWEERVFKYHQFSKATGSSFYGTKLSKVVEMFSLVAGILFIGVLLWQVAKLIWAKRNRVYKYPLAFFGHWMVQGVAIGVFFLYVLQTYLVEIVYIPSGSMEPLLNIGDRKLVCKSAHLPPVRGKVVSFYEHWSHRNMIKRVFLGPNDHFVFKDGTGYINETPIKLESLGGEKWVQKVEGQPDVVLLSSDPEKLLPRMEIKMNEDQVFMMGDHRDRSTDSREYGPINIKFLEGGLCDF